VRRVKRLCHDALVAAGEGPFDEGVRRLRIRGDETGDDRGAGQERSERGKALVLRAIDERMAVEVEAVEEIGAERQAFSHRRHVELAAEAAHGDLERVRYPIATEGNGLAVEDQACVRQRADGLDDLGSSAGHIVELAREDADVAPGLVDLYARAVEFVFEAG